MPAHCSKHKLVKDSTVITSNTLHTKVKCVKVDYDAGNTLHTKGQICKSGL
jgi:hypothetical protein